MAKLTYEEKDSLDCYSFDVNEYGRKTDEKLSNLVQELIDKHVSAREQEIIGALPKEQQEYILDDGIQVGVEERAVFFNYCLRKCKQIIQGGK